MATRIWTFAGWLHATLGTGMLVILVAVGLYALYVVKVHLGIDIFPDRGLHLPGPRTLLKMIARWLAP